MNTGLTPVINLSPDLQTAGDRFCKYNWAKPLSLSLPPRLLLQHISQLTQVWPLRCNTIKAAYKFTGTAQWRGAAASFILERLDIY